jgi:hypothetical protein
MKNLQKEVNDKNREIESMKSTYDLIVSQADDNDSTHKKLRDGKITSCIFNW